MTDQIKMVALRRFRLKEGQGFRWLTKGESYSVSKINVTFQENTGRGRRKTSSKPKMKGD